MRRRAFTLVEVLTVVAMIGILFAVGNYTFAAAAARSRDSRRATDLQFIRNGLEQFYLDNRSYPIYESTSDLPEASWQLESSYPCQSTTKKYLAPKYLANIPQDPSAPFVVNAGLNCIANSFGQYLYFGLPKDTSKNSYYLLARMERDQNVNYTSSVGNALSSYINLPNFCDQAQFSANPLGCSQNYFVTSSRND